MMAELVEVAIPRPVDRTFTYAIPEGREAEAVVGRRVAVPFRNRPEERGFIVDRPTEAPAATLKELFWRP